MSKAKSNVGTVYLLCFTRSGQPARYAHAGHYIGFASSLAARLEHHRKGTGANLLAVIRQAGYDFDCVRTWEEATRDDERKLKNRHASPRLCPRCKAESSSNARKDTIDRKAA